MKAKKYTKETINSIGMIDKGFPKFKVGDKIAVSLWVEETTEGSKKKNSSKENSENKRIQIFEGDVIAISNNGISSSFVVRKNSMQSFFVEKIFPYYSPLINSIEIKKRGIVRRAKLYYLRDKVGKKARIKEKIIRKSDMVEKDIFEVNETRV